MTNDAKAAGVSTIVFTLTDNERVELAAILQKFGAKLTTRGIDRKGKALMAMARAAATVAPPAVRAF